MRTKPAPQPMGIETKKNNISDNVKSQSSEHNRPKCWKDLQDCGALTLSVERVSLDSACLETSDQIAVNRRELLSDQPGKYCGSLRCFSDETRRRQQILMKKFLKLLLLFLGGVFSLMCVLLVWSILFEPVPDHESLVDECNAFIFGGAYDHISSEQQLTACLDDSYQALGAAPFIFIGLTLIFSVLAVSCFIFGRRIKPN